MTAVAAALLVTGCARTEVGTAVAPGPERVEAWQTVETYTIDQRLHTLRAGEWLRQPGHEARSRADAEAALGLKKLDPLPPMEAALEIAGVNPTDDLGFLALRFAFGELRSLNGPERQRYEETVYGLLETHYIHDLRLNTLLLSLVRFGGAPGVAFVDKVVEKSTERVLRARGAYWSATERLMAVDNLDATPAERAKVRAEVTRMARLVADEYSDVVVWAGKSGAEAIKPVLYALDHLTIGSVLPDASGQRIGGGQESLSQYRGKVLLLDFWATWCSPCVASLPKVAKLQERLGDKNFQVVAISVDDRVELVHEFMASRMALPFVNWYVGAKSELYSDWGIPGLPTYIVVDGDGVVRGRTNDVESLVGVILDATGADAATRAELRGKGRG